MSSYTDSELIGRLFVADAEVKPEILGRGPAAIRGAAYLQGPVLAGLDREFPNIWATVMIGPMLNTDSTSPIIPGALCTGVHNPYSLAVKGSSAFMDTVDIADNINVGKNLIAQGDVISRCGKHILSLKKNFDIPHPTKEGWRLRHTCPEGPSNDVYIKGRLTNSNKIILPEYWKNFVDKESIVVTITPVGHFQNIIVLNWTDEIINLQEENNKNIDCFYTVFAERIDGEKLIPEYEGTSPSDYPGNNDEYSVVGYHYDIKE